MVSTHPGEVDGRALRTFQRRGADWLRRHGPPKDVFFAQRHEPGECLQTDWTNANELEVRIAGERFAHLLCHSVLPYSNWEWAIPCLSESGLSLKISLQASLWELRGVPRFSQTDQSSTATHQLKRDKPGRGFNTDYLALCEHLGMTPRTIAVGSPNQNGDVEAAQGVLKRRLRNQLILRGSRDFDSLQDYSQFVVDACRGANALRATRLAEERVHLSELPAGRYPEPRPKGSAPTEGVNDQKSICPHTAISTGQIMARSHRFESGEKLYSFSDRGIQRSEVFETKGGQGSIMKGRFEGADRSS